MSAPVFKSKRKPRPIFTHQGYVLRLVKTLADGSGLLYCDMRQSIGCNASGKLVNGVVVMKSEHNGHEPDHKIASAKITRHHIKRLAIVSTGSPKEIIQEVQSTFGPLALGSRDSIAKMIHRARQQKVETSPSANNTEQSVETTSQSTSDDIVEPPCTILGETLEDVLKRIKEEDEDETRTPQNEIDMTLNEMEDESIETQDANPQENFFDTLINTVRETVKQEMQSAIKDLTPSSTRTQNYQGSSSDVNVCVSNFLSSLENLAALSNSNETKKRMDAVLEKIKYGGHKFNLEQLLECTLSQLEK